MTYDDDDLDRALAALPLEEPPSHLHARILAATAYRPRAPVSALELWLSGTLVALASWLAWLVASGPHAGERFAAAIAHLATSAGLTSEVTLLWLALGTSAAWWIAQVSVPAPMRRRIR